MTKHRELAGLRKRVKRGVTIKRAPYLAGEALHSGSGRDLNRVRLVQVVALEMEVIYGTKRPQGVVAQAEVGVVHLHHELERTASTPAASQTHALALVERSDFMALDERSDSSPNSNVIYMCIESDSWLWVNAAISNSNVVYMCIGTTMHAVKQCIII